MVHIIHIIESLGSGGAELVLYNNLRFSDPARFRHTVITVYSRDSFWNQSVRDLGIQVETLDCRSPVDIPRAVLRLSRWLRVNKPDILHSQLWTADVIGRLAARLAGVPSVCTIQSSMHDVESWNDGSGVPRWKRELVRLLDRWSTAFGRAKLIAVSEHVRRSTATHLRVPAQEIEVIHNSVAFDHPPDVSTRGMRQLTIDLNLPSESVILLHVGRVVAQKGLVYAIRALPAILRQDPGVHLVSAGPTSDADWTASLVSEARKLGVERHVHFLGVRRNVEGLLAQCDLFIFPSLFEGFPLALVEAMAAGCVCVASDTGAIPEMIEHDINGWLVPPRDVVAIGRAVSFLSSDSQRKRRLRHEAARSARARFDARNAAARLEIVYESVLAERTA
jgi:glycosyltransferase involved in cell wall biosynthesis